MLSRMKPGPIREEGRSHYGRSRSGNRCGVREPPIPPPSGLMGGSIPHFDDLRVGWLPQCWAVSAGAPYRNLVHTKDTTHTSFNNLALRWSQAQKVTSSSSSSAIILLDLRSRYFMDIFEYLAVSANRLDICWESGVLYDMIVIAHPGWRASSGSGQGAWCYKILT
jgi:hypothetical protein